jgi:hypothetical protein
MIYLLMVLTSLVSLNSEAQQTDKVSLVELYSSEGCSSCPPAEEALYNLKNHKNLWKTFVPINFHVDYWNRLGWIDVFSNKKFTDRQHSYANVWKIKRVYTPAFVVDGLEKGSSIPSLKESNVKSSHRISVDKTSENVLKVRLNTKNSSQFKINFALLANGLESVVKSGENAGRTLKHNFVVMELREEPINEIHEFKIVKPSVSYKSLSYAIWISDKVTSEVVQAVGGDLK